MIKKLKCLFGFHETDLIYFQTYNFNDSLYFVRCKKCKRVLKLERLG